MTTFYYVTLFLVVVVFWLYYYHKKNTPQPNFTKLANKNIVITGASRGIGKQIALLCSKGRANLFLVTHKSSSKLQNVVKECKINGSDKVFSGLYDLSKLDNCVKLVENVKMKFGDGIDYIFLSHVTGEFKLWYYKKDSLGDTNSVLQRLKSNEKIMSTNYFSCVNISTLLYPITENIVILSSTVGVVPSPYTTMYGATKSSLFSFFNSWKRELRLNTNNKNKNFNILLCCIGSIDTESNINATKNILSDDISRYSKEKCAEDIIGAAQNKLEIVYTPFHLTLPFVLMDFLCKGLVDRIFKKLFFTKKNN